VNFQSFQAKQKQKFRPKFDKILGCYKRIGPLAAIISIVFYLLVLYLFALSNTSENPFASIYSNSLIKTAYQHLLFLVGFDTLIYRKYYDTPPKLVGHQASIWVGRPMGWGFSFLWGVLPTHFECVTSQDFIKFWSEIFALFCMCWLEIHKDLKLLSYIKAIFWKLFQTPYYFFWGISLRKWKISKMLSFTFIQTCACYACKGMNHKCVY
jgi:hypothetical protein